MPEARERIHDLALPALDERRAAVSELRRLPTVVAAGDIGTTPLPRDHAHPAAPMTQHPLALMLAALLGGAIGTTVRLLPDPIDVTFIPAVAGFGAGLFVAIALLTGRDPNRAAVYGVRWGALVGTLLFVVAVIAK